MKGAVKVVELLSCGAWVRQGFHSHYCFGLMPSHPREGDISK
jgi:hypothetical protein